MTSSELIFTKNEKIILLETINSQIQKISEIIITDEELTVYFKDKLITPMLDLSKDSVRQSIYNYNQQLGEIINVNFSDDCSNKAEMIKRCLAVILMTLDIAIDKYISEQERLRL